MVDINLFHVRPSSRHPKNLAAYDGATHTYRPDYVNPTQWTLELRFDVEAALQQRRRDLVQHLRAVNQGSGRPHGDPLADEEAFERQTAKLESAIAELKMQISSHDFWFQVDKLGLSVTHADGTVSDHVASSQETVLNKLHPQVVVMKRGRYKVTAFTRRKTIPQVAPTQTQLKFTLKDLLICTIGDSYACGEGNPDVAANSNDGMRDYADMGPFRTLLAIRDDNKAYTPELELAQWQEPLAHRSYKSGHTLASEFASGDYGNMKIVTTHMSFARSGAGIERGLLAPNEHPRKKRRNKHLQGGSIGDNETLIETDEFAYLDECLNLGQIDEMMQTVKNRQIDFLLVTIGGNECGWIQGFVDIITFNNGITAKMVRDRVNLFIDTQLATQFIFLNDSLSKMPKPPRNVLLTLYPKGFFGAGTPDHPSTNRNCGIFDASFDLPTTGDLLFGSDSAFGIDNEEADIIKQLAINLNNKLRECVGQLNQLNRIPKPDMVWHIIDEIDNDFEVSGYCAVSTKFISAETSFLTQGDWGGIMHPNQQGQYAYGFRIADKVRSILNNQLDDFRPKENTLEPRVDIGGGQSGRDINNPF